MIRSVEILRGLIALVLGCGLLGGSGGADAQVRLTVSPDVATATIGEAVQFRAVVTGTADASVVWSVSGPQGSMLSAGTISASGLFQTPFPAPLRVTVTATSKTNGKVRASVEVSLKAPALKDGPALRVDMSKVEHEISPLVYGMNDFSLAPSVQAQVHLPIDRWGGDHTTRYNYLLDALNSGDDYFFENSNHADSKAPDGSELNAQVERDRRLGSVTMVTVPLIGFVTKRVRACGFPVSLYPAQQRINPQDGICGNGKLPDGKVITGNDPLLTSQPSDETFDRGWVKYLMKRYGDASHGGVKIFELDNEPEYWSSTHRDVHPEQMTYDELTDKGLMYAKAIKAADPTALVAGPVISGWMNYFYSMADVHHGWETGPCFCFNGAPTDRLAHGNVPLLAYYLQHFKKVQDEHGVRLLDILDLHAYYAAKGAQFAPAGDTAMQAARLNSTRALWDPTYRDQELTNPEVAVRKEKAPAVAPQLIPMMKRLVADNYPGTKLAITEYNWGGLESVNGALAQAEILALFGREGLDVGTLWGPPDAVKEIPGVMAYKMFEDYDGAGSKFGDGSLMAVSADQSQLAIYAAERHSDHMLTVLVLNKSFGDLRASVELATTATMAQVWQYGNADLHAIRRVADVKKEYGRLVGIFPAQSMTLFVMPR